MKITKARLKEMIREELKESVRQGRRPLRQTDRPPSDDLYGYSKEAIEIRNQLEEFGLEMSLEPSEKERKDLVAKIKQMIPEKEKKVEQYRYTDREKRLKYEEEIKKLKRLRRRIQYYVSLQTKDDIKQYFQMRRKTLPPFVPTKMNESARDMEILDSAVKSMVASRGPEVVAKMLREIADHIDKGIFSINEELTRQDKTDVKKMVQDELEKLLKKKDTKDQMGEIVKKIMKKLYKDLSLEHPYIIDRIKI